MLTTITGGKSFEQLSKANLRKVRATLDGDKLSDIDVQVFGGLLKRLKGESFFTYLDRRSKLAKLSLEDKQRLIESEKKRLVAEEKRKRVLLDRFVSGSPSNLTPAEIHSDKVSGKVNKAMKNSLSSLDSAIFDSFVSRRDGESLFQYLRRSKELYRLPVEEKKKLVDAHKQSIAQQKAEQQKLLDDYLRPTKFEQFSQVHDSTSQEAEKILDTDTRTHTRTTRSKGLSR